MKFQPPYRMRASEFAVEDSLGQMVCRAQFQAARFHIGLNTKSGNSSWLDWANGAIREANDAWMTEETAKPEKWLGDGI